MKREKVQQIDALVASISQIGKLTKELEFRSKKIVEELKQNKAQLMEEAFSDAFQPNKD